MINDDANVGMSTRVGASANWQADAVSDSPALDARRVDNNRPEFNIESAVFEISTTAVDVCNGSSRDESAVAEFR